jgi:hypothetical protein
MRRGKRSWPDSSLACLQPWQFGASNVRPISARLAAPPAPQARGFPLPRSPPPHPCPKSATKSAVDSPAAHGSWRRRAARWSSSISATPARSASARRNICNGRLPTASRAPIPTRTSRACPRRAKRSRRSIGSAARPTGRPSGCSSATASAN